MPPTKICTLTLVACVTAAAATPSSVTLTSSANPAILGQALTLTAAVSPASATGRITFYDGANVLGIGTLSGGKAVLTTINLPAGMRALRAFYAGDASDQPGASLVLLQRIASLGQSGFQAAVNYGGVTFPRMIVVSDFNGDGRADLAANDFDANKISVFLGKGDGTFQTAVTYATDLAPAQLAVADFNGDGRADIAVCNGASAASTVSVLIGNGDGTFRPGVNYKVGANPNHLVVSDFNGDGIADIATANFTDNNVSVLLGNGDGTFKPALNSAGPSGPGAIAVGDFNNDGIADLAAVNTRSVFILLGKGDGSFQAPITYTAGQNPAYVAVADFNSDGRADLAVGNAGDDSVSILLGKGDGTFGDPARFDAPKGLQEVSVGDFNGDGMADLVIADSGSNNVNVLLGNGDGTFHAAVAYAAGNQPIFVAAGDFNGDGRSDVAVANFVGANISVLLGLPSPGPHIAPGGVVGAGLSTPAVHALSPNAIATVFGDGFAPPGTLKPVGPGDLVNGRLPTNVNGVCVFVNNVAAPIFFLAPNQINFQAPRIPAPMAFFEPIVNVQLATSCGTAGEVRTFHEPVLGLAATPEFFYFKQSADGRNPIAAVNAVSGAFIGEPGLIAGVTFVPAAPGDVLTLFFTGGGATDPSYEPGELPGGIGSVAGEPGVTLAGTQLSAADIFYAGVTPGFAGLYQLNIRVPAGAPPGSQALILSIGGTASPAGYLFLGQ